MEGACERTAHPAAGRFDTREVQIARTTHLGCIATRHPKSTGGLPNAHKDLSVIEWSPDALRVAIKAWARLNQRGSM